jgi:pimeloyl-ACP methyl ester carboxylesterase
MSDLYVESWGAGIPVVLVHGSLATGADEWAAQRPLADEGFRLLVLDRRGYGRSPAAEGEDFLRDAEEIAELMGDGAHLVGHSYGGLSVLFAAARHPDATRSMALLEPSAFALGQARLRPPGLVAPAISVSHRQNRVARLHARAGRGLRTRRWASMERAPPVSTER